MNKIKNKIICVRHLQDQNALKSYGLNGPLEDGQEDKMITSAKSIKKEMEKGNFSRVRILYNDKTIRIEQTAKMLAKELGKNNVEFSLGIDKRLAIFEQGKVLLPKGYKDGEHFDPLMQAWDAISDEAYIYRNIDYRFGEGSGFKKYPVLAKSFLKNGESISSLLKRRYSFIEDFLNNKLREPDELLVVCTQSDLPLLLMELQEIAKAGNVRPEDLPFACWQTYKEKIQKKYDGDIPMGYTVSFDLSNIANSEFVDTVVLAREHLEYRASISPSSIQGKINRTDNDFSDIDSEFKKQTGVAIDSSDVIGEGFEFYPVSVVIPYYNSRSTILDVLQSVELQNLSKEEMKNVEVIIVDDGWNDDIAEIALPENYSFELNVITCTENGGRSTARNIGARDAKYDILIFLDADNLVSGECLREHSIRNKLAPNHLYTSLVANLFLEDVSKTLGQYLKNKKPLPTPSEFNEYRTREEISSDSVGIYEIKNNTVIEIMKETNNFRDYGFGRMVAYYDLPSMYATYCVSVSKGMFERIGGFSERFKGWGMEDAFFGAEGIVNNAKIIPILSCGSYSVNLPSHSGSENKEKEELAENVRRYRELIREVR